MWIRHALALTLLVMTLDAGAQPSCATFPPLPAGTLCVFPGTALMSTGHLNGDPDQGAKRFLIIPEFVLGDQKLRFGGATVSITYDQWPLETCVMFRQWLANTTFIELCSVMAPDDRDARDETRWTSGGGEVCLARRTLHDALD